jgi:hypothetical protein
MTILYKQDWDYYPEAIIDDKTKNKGFLRLAALYKSMGVENHAFILALHDRTLQGVNPYDPDLTEETKIRILTEIRSNFWYFLREIARVPTHDTLNIIHFKPNRGIIAAYWTYFNHIQQVVVFPRQTGKSFGIDWLSVWTSLFGATDYIINVLTKDDKLRARNMSRIKSMMECIPPYLQFKKKSDPANSEQILVSRLSNQINAFVPNPSPKLAYNVARGSSAGTFVIDEFGYILHIEIILASAMPATTAARELAAMKGEPYGNISRHPSDRTAMYSLSHMLEADDKRTIKLMQEADTQAKIQYTSETPKAQGKTPLQAFVKYTEKSQPLNTQTIMTPHIIVTTQVNINGVNADTYSDATLFAMIQQQEAEVKNLLSITHKPQALLNEIEKRQAGIEALVVFMDEREAKRNPQPPQPAKPTGPDLQNLQGSI